MAPEGREASDRIDRHLDQIESLDELTDERYHATHERFEAASNQRDLIIEWLGELADGIAFPTDRPTRLLSVGCGGGVMDQRITDVFADHVDSLTLAGVDPNPRHTDAFEELFASEGFSVETFTGMFEDYRPSETFDVIHMIHCLYYFEHIEPELREALGMLEPGGSLVVLQAPNDDLNHLADRVWKKQFDQSAWYSDDVVAVLESLDCRVSMHRLDAHVDVTECLEPDSEAGIDILDFIVQANTRQFPSEVRTALRTSLRAICVERGGRLLAEHPVDAIVATRGN